MHKGCLPVAFCLFIFLFFVVLLVWGFNLFVIANRQTSSHFSINICGFCWSDLANLRLVSNWEIGWEKRNTKVKCQRSLLHFSNIWFWCASSLTYEYKWLYQEIVTLSVQINVISFSAGFGFLINTSYVCNSKDFSKH